MSAQHPIDWRPVTATQPPENVPVIACWGGGRPRVHENFGVAMRTPDGYEGFARYAGDHLWDNHVCPPSHWVPMEGPASPAAARARRLEKMGRALEGEVPADIVRRELIASSAMSGIDATQYIDEESAQGGES